jgi:hypothetical protein
VACAVLCGCRSLLTCRGPLPPFRVRQCSNSLAKAATIVPFGAGLFGVNIVTTPCNSCRGWRTQTWEKQGLCTCDCNDRRHPVNFLKTRLTFLLTGCYTLLFFHAARDLPVNFFKTQLRPKLTGWCAVAKWCDATAAICDLQQSVAPRQMPQQNVQFP